MSQVIASASVRGVLIDLAGVLHTGDLPIPGAIESLSRLRHAGLPLRFLTNTTRSTRVSVVNNLTRMGFELYEEEVMTAVHATKSYVTEYGLVPHWLIHPEIEVETGPSALTPNAVVLGDAGPYFTFDAMNAAFRLLMGGLPLIAMARNRYFQEPEGLTLDMGAYVTALEYATGKQAIVIGKPSIEFFTAALRDMNVLAQDAIMIGDDLRDDIQGAQTAGVRGILVRTGKYRPQDEQAPGGRPTAIADDFSAAVTAILA